MKDFKSLVSTIREMNQRNSELRKKVHNVARPDDAAPTSDQSKLSKQAEIKTKIIDEEQIDEKYGKGYVSPASKIEKAMAAKGIAPNSSDKHKAEQDRLDKEYEKIKKNEETINEIGDTVSGQERLKKTELRATARAGAAAGDDVTSDRGYDKDKMKKNIKVTMQARKRIKEEIVNEASQDTQGDVKAPDEKKSKKQNDTDSVDAKEIKGGKTEVVINPKTDDSTEDSTKETEDSKKTRKTENSKIGAKGMKEETKMFNSHKNFGLSDSLIAAAQAIVEKKIDEKLVGNQHKIDANHNGKIDAHDFKLLKGKKKMNEGVCPKCGKNPCECSAVKEDVEQIDELSRDTVRSYARKAIPDNKEREAKVMKPFPLKDMDKNTAMHKKMQKRNASIELAGKKAYSIGGDAKVNATEEVEFSADEIARIEAIAKDME